MTKRDLVDRVSKGSGLNQQVVMRLIQKMLHEIRKAILNGEKVELRNFGVFSLQIRKARKGRNPNLPENEIPIPTRHIVKFKAGKEMREGLQKLTLEKE